MMDLRRSSIDIHTYNSVTRCLTRKSLFGCAVSLLILSSQSKDSPTPITYSLRHYGAPCVKIAVRMQVNAFYASSGGFIIRAVRLTTSSLLNAMAAARALYSHKFIIVVIKSAIRG